MVRGLTPPRFTKAGRIDLIHDEEMYYMQRDIDHLERLSLGHVLEEAIEIVEHKLRVNEYHKAAKKFVRNLENFKFVSPGHTDAIARAQNPDWTEWWKRKYIQGYIKTGVC